MASIGASFGGEFGPEPSSRNGGMGWSCDLASKTAFEATDAAVYREIRRNKLETAVSLGQGYSTVYCGIR